MADGLGEQDLPTETDPLPAPIAEPQLGSADPQPVVITAKPIRKARFGKTVNEYPERIVRYYQMARSDIRSLGVAQAAATICAGIGTWALSNYIEFGKDIANLEAQKSVIPDYMRSIVSLAFWAWIIFWAVAFFAFVYQGVEFNRIKEEHGEITFWKKIKTWTASKFF